MTYTALEVSRHGPVAQIQLCRPTELNTMTRAFWSELPDALRSLDDDGETRVVVISSTGKHFTAGIGLFQESCRLNRSLSSRI